MKKLTFYCFVVSSLSALSCRDNNITADVGFIKAEINGVETIYKTPSENSDLYNYIRPGALNITFKKNQTSTQYWSIDVIYGYTALDINDLPLPFMIKGPNPDYSGKSPEFHTTITDPMAGPYGRQFATGSTFDHDFSFVITSVKNNIIKGNFQGSGVGEFENGEFSARLARKNW